MARNNNEIPKPNYDTEVSEIVKVYKEALESIQREIADVATSDMSRAFLLVKEASIKQIIDNLNRQGLSMVDELLTNAALDGVARTIVNLGYVESYETARQVAKFGELNTPFVHMIIADTQDDMLKVTRNMEKQSKQAIRRAITDVMREQYALGEGKGSVMTRELVKELNKMTDLAIIDNAGRKWKIETYAHMAVQTNAMNAHRTAAINEGLEDGARYGIISKHGAKDACRRYEGKIVSLVPDDKKYIYVEELPKSEVFHPHCKHVVNPIFDPSKYEK